jgi:uncharacterized membrane protein YbhN (UPF0104 family)
VASWRNGAEALDATFTRIGARAGTTWAATAAFLGCWLLESIETAIILRLVGAPLDLAFAMAAEVGISLLRSVSNVAPAGLGVQDAGYATLFPAMGLTVDTAAAFVLLKRGKELAWIVAGYTLLAALRRRDRAVGAGLSIGCYAAWPSRGSLSRDSSLSSSTI